jgi:hypothetical protein
MISVPLSLLAAHIQQFKLKHLKESNFNIANFLNLILSFLIVAQLIFFYSHRLNLFEGVIFLNEKYIILSTFSIIPMDCVYFRD